MYIYVLRHIYIYTYTHVNVYITYIYIYTYMHIHIYIRTYIYTYMQACIHTSICRAVVDAHAALARGKPKNPKEILLFTSHVKFSRD